MSLKIDADLEGRVIALANLREMEVEAVLREAVFEYVTREEARDSFLQEALASLRSYGVDGLHLSGDELSEWLQAWGAGDEAGMPECHG